jgi:hypothetical protein
MTMTETTQETLERQWQNLYFQALGLATTAWASLEFVLDLNIHVISAHYGGKSISTQVPLALNQKLKFLRRAFTGSKMLELFRAHGNTDIDKINALSEMRHELIHGATLQYLGENYGTMGAFGTFKLNFDLKTEHRLSRRQRSVANIGKFTDQVTPLINSQVALGQAMRAPFPGGTLEDADS